MVLALSVLSLPLARAQDAPEVHGVVIRSDQGYCLELAGPARERVVIASAPPALQALVDQTIRVQATFLEEVGGALGQDDAGARPARRARLRFLEPELALLRGRVQSGPRGAVLATGDAAQVRLEGERSILLLATVQDEVELEGWRFPGSRPFLVSAVRAAATSKGYLSAHQRSAREGAYRKLADVAAGERLFVSRLALHRRGDDASPFRDLGELDLEALDVDGSDGAGDEDQDVLMAFTRPAVSPQGEAVPAGFIPLRKLDLGTPERQRALASALAGVDTRAPEQGGIVQQLRPAVR
jgi:hypothetical protein